MANTANCDGETVHITRLPHETSAKTITAVPTGILRHHGTSEGNHELVDGAKKSDSVRHYNGKECGEDRSARCHESPRTRRTTSPIYADQPMA